MYEHLCNVELSKLHTTQLHSVHTRIDSPPICHTHIPGYTGYARDVRCPNHCTVTAGRNEQCEATSAESASTWGRWPRCCGQWQLGPPTSWTVPSMWVPVVPQHCDSESGCADVSTQGVGCGGTYMAIFSPQLDLDARPCMRACVRACEHVMCEL